MQYTAVNVTSQQYLGLNLLQLFLFMLSRIQSLSYHAESVHRLFDLSSAITSLNITPATTQQEKMWQK